jgi:uncharacterized membrane protein YjjB (DUF3815 family)
MEVLPVDVQTTGASARRTAQRARFRRQEIWVAVTGLIAALLALPLAPASHSPEVASVLAVSSVALLAGHRWAIALVVLAELLLLPGLWPRLLVQPPDIPARIAIAAACLSAVPGILAMRRASAALIAITGVRRTRLTCRAGSVALALCLVVGALLPIV